jgi:hypothetical protein
MVERHPNIVPVKLDVDDDESVRACVTGVTPIWGKAEYAMPADHSYPQAIPHR